MRSPKRASPRFRARAPGWAAIVGLLVLSCGPDDVAAPKQTPVPPDSIAPTLEIWVQDTITSDTVVVLHGRATDDRGLMRLGFTRAGEGWTEIPIVGARLTEFTQALRWIVGYTIDLTVLATDSNRNHIERTIQVYYDPVAPWGQLVAPALATSATPQVLIEAYDYVGARVARISWQEAGGAERLLATPGVQGLDAVASLPLASESTALAVHLDDGARNRTTLRAITRRVSNVLDLSAGPYHACAVDGDGAAWCWGRNEYGALGDGAVQEHDVPFRVPGLPRLKAITAGGSVTCGLAETGDAYCWGVWAQSWFTPATPVLNPTLVPGGHTFSTLNAGFDFACGLDGDGTAWCWGNNDNGQLGTGDTLTGTLPRAVLAPGPLVSLTTGMDHACGLTPDGTALCWGRNGTGQLGNGVYEYNPTTIPVVVSGGRAFSVLTAGFWYTCGLVADGRAFCWGDATGGRLGNGAGFGSFNEPQEVLDGHTFALLGAGYPRTCAVDLTGQTWCWGGTAANGAATWEFLQPQMQMVAFVAWPVRTAPGLTFTALSEGGATCALSAARAVYCWGTEVRSLLGNGP